MPFNGLMYDFLYNFYFFQLIMISHHQMQISRKLLFLL